MREQMSWSQLVPKDWVVPMAKAAEKAHQTRTEWVRCAIEAKLPDVTTERLSVPRKTAIGGRQRAEKSNRWNQYVPADWLYEIDKECSRVGMSRAEWVRQAIREALPQPVAAKLSTMRKPGNPNWV